MTIREMRTELGETQSEFAARYSIPFRTIQNWETGLRKPPEYMLRLLEQRVRTDLSNRRTVLLPLYDSAKKNLPERKNFIGAAAWLQAVQAYLGNNVVFALDAALMCQGLYGGHSGEYLVYIYGKDSFRDYNGVVVLGNYISPHCVRCKNGLTYTDFSRTVCDALANESILDMQGITEALSHYYYSNGEAWRGISVPPEYQLRFEKLAEEAIAYYDD